VPRNRGMKKILVVDDDPMSRDLVRLSLESADLQVLEAENGSEALRIIGEVRPDLVLMDIRMPFMDGFDVIAELKKDPSLRSLPVVGCTADAQRAEREKALAAGFTAYVAKPMQHAFLTELVELFLWGGQEPSAG
jgi:CheY-like chemotaxis protein